MNILEKWIEFCLENLKLIKYLNFLKIKLVFFIDLYRENLYNYMWLCWLFLYLCGLFLRIFILKLLKSCVVVEFLFLSVLNVNVMVDWLRVMMNFIFFFWRVLKFFNVLSLVMYWILGDWIGDSELVNVGLLII